MNAPHIHPDSPQLSSSTPALRVTPLLSIDAHEVQYYFQTLAVHELLEERFSDIESPTWSDVVAVITRMGQQMYLVVNQKDRIVGEFMLENFTGRSAQVHFSMSPEVSPKERLAAGKLGLRHTLHCPHPDRGYFLDSIYGLTPLVNRAACGFALRAGLKRQGVLPSGMTYKGEPVDCMISVCTRKTLRM